MVGTKREPLVQFARLDVKPVKALENALPLQMLGEVSAGEIHLVSHAEEEDHAEEDQNIRQRLQKLLASDDGQRERYYKRQGHGVHRRSCLCQIKADGSQDDDEDQYQVVIDLFGEEKAGESQNGYAKEICRGRVGAVVGRVDALEDRLDADQKQADLVLPDTEAADNDGRAQNKVERPVDILPGPEHGD